MWLFLTKLRSLFIKVCFDINTSVIFTDKFVTLRYLSIKLRPRQFHLIRRYAQNLDTNFCYISQHSVFSNSDLSTCINLIIRTTH